MKKKALIIAYNGLSKVGGVQNVIYQTILSLNDIFDFDIIVFNDDDYYLKKLKNQGINNINIIKISFPFIHKFFGVFYKQLYLYRFANKLFCSNKYDVVHSFKELDSWPFLKAAYKANIPIRILHNNVVHSFKKNNLHSKCRLIRSKKKSLKYASICVAASKHCGDVLYSGRDYLVIYNSFDSTKFKICNSKIIDLSIIQVGIFCQNKNQLFTIDVFSNIKKTINNASLTLIGYEVDKGYLEKMKNKIDSEGINKSVRIVDGRKDDAEKYMNKSSCLLLPSHFEGASIVAIEAQACGIPVFASTNISPELNCGGMKRLKIDEIDSANKWAKEIIGVYKINNNVRKQYNLDKFKFDSFKKQIRRLYDIK